MFDGFTDLIAGSLSLEEPWYVEGAEFNSVEKEFHIHIGVRKSASFACPICGKLTKRYGYEPKERVWRHGDTMFYPTYVHCRRPRILCSSCGVKQINAPFERKNSRFTLLFEGYAMLLLADVPRAKASRLLRCDEKSLASILHYWVQDAVDKRLLDDVRRLAIDETSFHKGHSYVTVIIDADQRRVIDVENGREKETISIFADKLDSKSGDRNSISAVSSDMSKSYVPAIAECFPNAVNIIDKFHVKKLLIDALDDIRKEEQKSTAMKRELFLGRKLFMIPAAKLTGEQASKLLSLSRQYPKTGRAYRIIASLDDFYLSRDPREAAGAFDHLYSWMRRCRLEPMKNAALTLMRHREKILSYFDQRITNAICEGINSMIQAAKRKARGFNTFKGYASMIYLIAGKLELAVPCPM